jgi:hypothetical protein
MRLASQRLRVEHGSPLYGGRARLAHRLGDAFDQPVTDLDGG